MVIDNIAKHLTVMVPYGLQITQNINAFNGGEENKSFSCMCIDHKFN